MNKKACSRLWLYFTGIIFATICAVFLLICAIWFLLFETGRVSIDPRDRHAPLLLFAFGSLLLGAVIAVFVGKRIVRPVQNMGNAFAELSRGNFNVQVSENEKILEIQKMARRFNAMVHDLSHMETLRSDFVANVSHEFKTPLAAIEGYAALLQNPVLSPEKRERYVEKILENSRRLSRMSGNILLLSKLENQELPLEREEYRIDEQLRQCVLLLENKWTPKGIEFDIEMPRQSYCGSRALLEQAWLNLLDNAVRYSPVGGRIRIRTSVHADTLRVSIADQGEGMTEEVQKHIFEKFYQGDGSRKGEGNGLGLALVKRIVELCGGTIEVNSEPNRGTEFIVVVPTR